MKRVVNRNNRVRFLLDRMAGGRSPCLLEYGLVSLMTNDLGVLGWITKAAQFSGRDAKCGTGFNMSGQNNGTK